MKRFILICFLIFGLSSSVSAISLIGSGIIASEGATDYTADANCQGAWFMAGNGSDNETEPDHSGNDYHLAEKATKELAVVSGAGNVPAGYSGSSRDFEASNYDELLIVSTDSNAPGLDISGADQDMAICAWIKAENVANGGNYTIASKYSDSGNEQCWLHINGTGDTTYRVVFHISIDGSTDVVATGATTNLAEGAWHHICGQYDDDNGSNQNLQVWVNGSMDGSTSHTAGIYNGTSDFDVGDCADGTGNEYDGLIDELIVFDRSLSSAEINEIMDSGIDGSNGAND